MTRQMHLNLFIHSRGHHEASWRHQLSTPLSVYDIRYYQDLAQRAERACFDSIFLADQLALPDDIAQGPRTGLEPVTVLAATAVATNRIGMIATCSTTYTEPFNLARQFGSLDLISGGRIGWNIVTSWMAAAAKNFSRAEPLTHAQRYDQAEDYMGAVLGLWDSWGKGALIDDRTSGRFADAELIRPVNHEGPYYQVAGPLNLPRSPQGRPVLVQAGSSEAGRSFAARYAEAIFTAQLEMSAAQDFYGDIKARAKASGRNPDQVLVLPGLSPLVASTEAEADRMMKELGELTDPEVGRKRLSGRFGGHDFSDLPLDVPLKVTDFPDPSEVEAARSRTEMVIEMVRKEGLTLREVLARLAGARGHYTFSGTPDKVADLMETWFAGQACDGFNVMPPLLPTLFDTFADEVVPILRRRGLFREEYSGSTLRSHYGLDEPKSQFDPA